MEVHHHPHVEKKNFKEYFLEFLMIFLAVTMGFFAGNIRESISSHQREYELISQMLEDLKKDTSDMQVRANNTSNTMLGIDTLTYLVFDCAKKPLPDSLLAKMYYLYFTASVHYSVHIPQTNAIRQLEKENGLILIRKKKVADSILYYGDLNERSVIQAERCRDVFQVKARDAAAAIFDGALLTDGLKPLDWGTSFEKYSSGASKKFRLLTNNEITLGIYGFKLIDLRHSLDNYLSILQFKKKVAISLIGFIKQQYQLNEE